MSVQPISPGTVVARIWEIYRDQFGVLAMTALVLYALQFVINLVLSAAAGIALAVVFWALSVLYQGMVVKVVQDVQDGRRDHSVGELLRSVEPVFWPLVAVSILFGIGVGIGFVLLIIPAWSCWLSGLWWRRSRFSSGRVCSLRLAEAGSWCVATVGTCSA
jgi:hypothetical protein